MNRRRILRLATLGMATGLAGCSSTGSEDSASTLETEQLGAPSEAEFEFAHNGENQSLSIRYEGGDPLSASNVQIQSSSGTTVRWHNLGTTSIGANEQLSQGSVATIGSEVLNWGEPLTPESTIYVVYQGGEGTSSTISKYSVPSESTAASADFVDQFESGDYDGWSTLWLPENSGGPRNILNDWSVVQQPALQGEYSLELHSVSDHNALATDDHIIELSEDFEFSFEFYFENQNSRGAKTSVIDVDRNGSEDGERVSTEHLSPFISAYRKPAEEEVGLNVLGNVETVDYSEISPQNRHTVRLSRSGQTVTGYLNGSEINSFQASESETNLDESYRLVLISSGSWGDESRIWWDSIRYSSGR